MTEPNWKGIVNEHATGTPGGIATYYDTKRVGGSDHQPIYECVLTLGNQQVTCRGSSKHDAEKGAAKEAAQMLRSMTNRGAEKEAVQMLRSMAKGEAKRTPMKPSAGAVEFQPSQTEQGIQWTRRDNVPHFAPSSHKLHFLDAAMQPGWSPTIMPPNVEAIAPPQHPVCVILELTSDRGEFTLIAKNGVTWIGLINKQNDPPNLGDLVGNKLPTNVEYVRNKNTLINTIFFRVGQHAQDTVILWSKTISQLPYVTGLLQALSPNLLIQQEFPHEYFETSYSVKH